jgi:ABC-2 type transport system permease protein
MHGRTAVTQADSPVASPVPDSAAVPSRRREPRPTPGWAVVASKELADYVTSWRFVILFVVLGIATVLPVFLATGAIRDQVESATSEIKAVFLGLFLFTGDPLPADLPFVALIGILGPLLGIAFGFDAINSERTDGTLPRLVAQPIHRDDVINGKFVAGLLVIGIMFLALIGLVAGVGIIRLGIAPSPQELLRIFAWFGLTCVYVGFWLAFAMLVSVLVRRAATAALVAFGVWLLVTIFGRVIGGVLSGVLASNRVTTIQDALSQYQLSALIQQFFPGQQYSTATASLLFPQARVEDLYATGSLGQIQQAALRLPSVLSLDQSFTLIWPQVVALVALMIVSFACAYVAFMRQEVRA